ncbi:MAG: right-handed parallel beta-helix repeat-containing protein [Acidobacteriota bacterium]|nr:MAG: right-handed parallel beta-helix repeat-containing protein [Acidobacteriota bacterium]
MNETEFARNLSSAPAKSGWMRRLLILAIGLIGLFAGGLIVIGLIPFTPDIPPAGLTNGNPGSGGLRRPFPAMNARESNPVTSEKVALGRLLFFDPIISGDNTQSCATCHHPDLGFTDGRNISMGIGGKGVGPARTGGKDLVRNAPSVWNAAWFHRLFWDGRAKDLEDQARNPITSADEMNQNPDQLVLELRAIPEYVEMFAKAFGETGDRAVTFDNVTNAIAAFERTIVSNNSPFDRYAAGETTALTPEQRRGLTLFRSLKTRCFECHGFPTFANPDFKVIGVPPMPGQTPDPGRSEIEGGEPYKFAFKVPTLRNVALTPPYMHNGRFQTLEEVVDFYSVGGGQGFGLDLPNLDDKIRRFSITQEEKRDLVAFLHALTDESKKPEIPEKAPSGLPVVPRLERTARGSALPAPVAPAPSLTRTQREPGAFRVKPGESIQAVLDRSIPGDVIEILPGVYHEMLLVDVDNITIRGIKENDRRAVLDGRNKLTDAVITSSHNFTIEGLSIRDFVNNGITVHGGTNAAFRDLVVHNTGLYGVYPVECKGVLVENCLVTGIRDAAIYVGQSRDIIVRNNEAHHNVTGIEIENSVNALVENNYVHQNTGGILVFLLPNNPSKVGSDSKVVGNRIINNNHPNFGDASAIVGRVVPGSGLIIMAADRTDVTQNEIRGNDSFGIAVVSLSIAYPKGRTCDVGSIPEGNRIHGNKFADNGRNPAGIVKEMGAINIDLLWDGSGWDNTWNETGVRTFPAVLPSDNWPAIARKSYTRIFAFLRDRLL